MQCVARAGNNYLALPRIAASLREISFADSYHVSSRTIANYYMGHREFSSNHCESLQMQRRAAI